VRSLKIRRNGQRGAALTEFAIVLPLLLLLVFGIIEFGVLLYDKAMITNASREGARAGIVFRAPRVSGGEIQSVVDNYVASHLITFGPAATATTTTDPADPTSVAAGDMLRVTVSYPYRFLLVPIFLTDLAGGVNLSATTVMRVE